MTNGSNLVAVASQDIARNVELYGLSLRAVANSLQIPALDQLDPSTRQAVLFDQAAPGAYLGDILVLDEHGDVIEAIENGYDVTGNVRRFRADREKKTQGKRGPPIDIDLEFKLPFEGSQQSRYRFSVTGGTALAPRVHFEPKGERHRLWVGDATLDAATGTILSLFGHPAILPAFVDQIDVHMEFNPSIPAGTLPSRMVVEGGGHFLWFHKRMRYTSVTAVPVNANATAAATPAGG